MSHNEDLAHIFEQMAEMYELQGNPNDTFRIRAYYRAAMIIRSFPVDIQKLYESGKLKKTAGIGPNLFKKIEDFLKTGKVKQHEFLKKIFPDSLLDLLLIQHLGPKKLKVLYQEFGVIDLYSLEKVLKEGGIADYPGFGEKTIHNILDGITLFKSIQKRIPLGNIYFTVNEIIGYMKNCKALTDIKATGSFRRKTETIGDIDILTTGKDHEAIARHFINMPNIDKVLAHGKTKASVILDSGRQVDLRVVNKDEWGSALQYFTGSKQHNVHLRTIAKNVGIKLNEYGAFKGDKKIAGEKEESMYKCLKMQWIPPELREDRGEIETAQKKKIPKLLTLNDIKGNLHVHSTWSDGRNTIEEMAEAARKKGYKYIVITDHSKRLTVANELDEKRIREKHKEIDELNKKMDITILKGTEVDILDDGNLDYTNDILKKFDFVIAAIHHKMKQDNTERILKSMDNPYIHAIAHISGRIFGQRDEYALDYDKIFKKAAKTKTLLEINAQPARLDIREKYIKEAKKQGVKFMIGTDAHKLSSLWFMELGVSMARRGWLTKNDIANCWDFERVRKYVNKK